MFNEQYKFDMAASFSFSFNICLSNLMHLKQKSTVLRRKFWLKSDENVDKTRVGYSI
jgi:hypothetical protein